MTRKTHPSSWHESPSSQFSSYSGTVLPVNFFALHVLHKREGEDDLDSRGLRCGLPFVRKKSNSPFQLSLISNMNLLDCVNHVDESLFAVRRPVRHDIITTPYESRADCLLYGEFFHVSNMTSLSWRISSSERTLRVDQRPRWWKWGLVCCVYELFLIVSIHALVSIEWESSRLERKCLLRKELSDDERPCK